MVGILQLAYEFDEVTHVPGLDRNMLRHGCSACPRMPECDMARATLVININTEPSRDDFQILHAPVAGILPHPGKDLLGIGYDSMVPNTAPWNNPEKHTASPRSSWARQGTGVFPAIDVAITAEE
jgi:hypothetical protein